MSGETVAYLFGKWGIIVLCIAAILILGTRTKRGCKVFSMVIPARKIASGSFFIPLWTVVLLFLSALMGLLLFLSECHMTEADYVLSEGTVYGKLSGSVEQIRQLKEDQYQVNVSHVTITSGDMIYHLKGKTMVFVSAEEKNTDMEDILPGRLLTADGALYALESPTNPGEFNTKTYCYASGIFYRFAGKHCETYRENCGVGQLMVNCLKRNAFFLKKQMRDVYRHVMPESDAAYLEAMVLGDKSNLTDEQRMMYEENGVMHLLAISGV